VVYKNKVLFLTDLYVGCCFFPQFFFIPRSKVKGKPLSGTYYSSERRKRATQPRDAQYSFYSNGPCIISASILLADTSQKIITYLWCG
jgi:hypothetical protein